MSRKLKGADNPDLGVNYDSESIIIMDFAYDEELALKALGRNVVSKVQTCTVILHTPVNVKNEFDWKKL